MDIKSKEEIERRKENKLKLIQTVRELSKIEEYREMFESIERSKKEESDEVEFLLDADENCNHEIVSANGGGIRCTKCRGWFCY